MRHGESCCLKCKEPMTDSPVMLHLKAERHGWSVARLERFQRNYHNLGLCVAPPPRIPKRRIPKTR